MATSSQRSGSGSQSGWRGTHPTRRALTRLLVAVVISLLLISALPAAFAAPPPPDIPQGPPPLSKAQQQQAIAKDPRALAAQYLANRYGDKPPTAAQRLQAWQLTRRFPSIARRDCPARRSSQLGTNSAPRLIA